MKIVEIKKIYEKNREMIAYVFTGAMTTVIGLAVYYGMTEKFFDVGDAFELQCANVLTWIVSVMFAYFANRMVVFRSNGELVGEIARFFGARTVSLLVDMGLMFLLVSILKMEHKIVKPTVQVIVIGINYLMSKFLVFVKKGEGENACI